MKAGDLRKGQYIEYRGEPFQIIDTEFSFHGRGSAHMKVKLKDLSGESSRNVTYKTGDQVTELNVASHELQFLYQAGDEAVFMNPRTYEQTPVKLSLFNGKEKFLIPETKVYLQFYDDEVVGVSLPPKVELKVIRSPLATAGNRAKAAKKEVTLETGLKVQAPLFVDKGDVLIVDTESGEYISRA